VGVAHIQIDSTLKAYATAHKRFGNLHGDVVDAAAKKLLLVGLVGRVENIHSHCKIILVFC
jgi:hypothetical protein